jgi:hypothetical protein
MVKATEPPCAFATTSLNGETDAIPESCEPAYTVVASFTVTVTCAGAEVKLSSFGWTVIASSLVRARESGERPCASASAPSADGAIELAVAPAPAVCGSVEVGATPAPPPHAIRMPVATTAAKRSRKRVIGLFLRSEEERLG